MMYQVNDDEGSALDAHFEMQDRDLVLHSRSGTRGSENARNVDYSEALRLILRRLESAGISILSGWVDSTNVQRLPPEQRVIWTETDIGSSADQSFRLLSGRMKDIGRATDFAPGGGNSTKKIRLRLDRRLEKEAVQATLGATATDARLPANLLNQVTSEHIWNAVQYLSGGGAHVFGESRAFDLVAGDGKRLPPKAVFGIAATEALGFQVLPHHFSGGLGTPCFRALEAANFQVVQKGHEADPPDDESDLEVEGWGEGRKRLVSHVRRERARGLAAAKKAWFIRTYGHLYCEQCGTIPSDKYEPAVSDACIEVHHRAFRVEQMADGHVTKLEDLSCLCANCHRVTHRRLRVEAEKAEMESRLPRPASEQAQ